MTKPQGRVLLAAAALQALALGAALSGDAPGVVVLGPDDAPSIAADAIVLHLTGPIDVRSAAALKAALDAVPATTRVVILRLDSSGGDNRSTDSVRARLAAASAAGLTVRTLVHQGDVCASACVLVFMAGTERYAGNASVWGFHGACLPGSNVPDARSTARFLGDLRNAGISARFLDTMKLTGCLSEPGVWWLSGYELAEVYDAGIVTHLLPAWQPEYARTIGPAPGLAPR